MTDEEKRKIFEQVLKEQFDSDVVAFEDMHVMPLMDTEYHSRYFYIGLCLSGYITGQHDYHDYRFCAGDICWVLPGHVLSHRYVSDDYKVLSIFVSEKYFDNLKHQGALGKYQYITNMDSVSLPPAVFDSVHEAFRLLISMKKLDVGRNVELRSSVISIITTIVDEHIARVYPDMPSNQKLHEELFERFHDAVVKHYRESREVSYYACLLCRSPKYFATVIKETTGIPATEWINRYVIIEAKWMLRRERQKSIQQIAGQLGFSEHASFSRLFKKMEGITPTEYREQI